MNPNANWFAGFHLPFPEGCFSLPYPSELRLFHPMDHHLTVAFLGKLTEVQSRTVYEEIQNIDVPTFHLAFEKILLLPKARKFSAVCLSQREDDPKMISWIAEVRDHLFDAAGIAHDPRPPLIHLTFGRPGRYPTKEEIDNIFLWKNSVQVNPWKVNTGALELFTWTEKGSERKFREVEY